MRDLSRRGMEYIIIELCICTWRVFCQNVRPFVFDIFNTDILPYYLDCASVWKNGVLSSSMQSILCCPRTTYLLKDFLNLRHALLKFLFELFSWTLVYVLVCTKKFPPPKYEETQREVNDWKCGKERRSFDLNYCGLLFYLSCPSSGPC